MVLLKPEDKSRLEQMRQQCGQERDLQIKQVENGFIIQAVTRFFVDQGSGPVQAGEINDTTIAVTAYEAGTIAGNYMRSGEFWPGDPDFDHDHPDAWASEAKGDPVLDALMPEVAYKYDRPRGPEKAYIERPLTENGPTMPEQIAATRARIEKDVEPPHTKPMDAFDTGIDDATD